MKGLILAATHLAPRGRGNAWQRSQPAIKVTMPQRLGKPNASRYRETMNGQ